MRYSRAVLGTSGSLYECTCCTSLEPLALTSSPCEQRARLRLSTQSCMLVQHGGVVLTKQIGPGLAGSCEDCSRLVLQAQTMPDIDASISSAELKLLNRSNPTNFTCCGHCSPLAQHKHFLQRRVHL